MNYKEAQQWLTSGKLNQLEIMRSPENKQDWFLMACDKNNKCFMFVDDNEMVKTFMSLDDAIIVIKHIGFKIAVVHV